MEWTFARSSRGCCAGGAMHVARFYQMTVCHSAYSDLEGHRT